MKMRACRTCMSKHDLSPLFSEFSVENFTTEQLFLVTGVQIKINDGLPQLACKTCIRRISKSIYLREISMKVDEMYKSFLKISDTDYKNNYNDMNVNKLNDCATEQGLKDIDEDSIDQYECNSDIQCTNEFVSDTIDNESNVTSICNKSAPVIDIKSTLFKSGNTENFIQKLIKDTKDGWMEKIDKILPVEKNCVNTVKEESDVKIKIEDVMSKDDLDELIREAYDLRIANEFIGRPKNSMDAYENGWHKQSKLTVLKKEERKNRLMSLAVTPYPKSGPIQCSMCFSKLKNRAIFLTHATTHFEPEFPCPFCDKKFHVRAHLNYHQERKHGKKKRLGCEECEYRAVDRLALLNHVRAKHTGERPYVCDECGAAFRMRNNLKQHLPKHYGIKNMQCELCPQRFVRRSELWGHQMKVHFMIYTYHCYLCTESFKTSKPVKNHLLKVHGVPEEQQLKIKCVKTRRSDHSTSKSSLDIQPPPYNMNVAPP